jgi:hypothetical protein
MKPRLIKYVKQEHEKGCLIACIAMVLGWDYSEVVKEFENDFDKHGTDGEMAKQFICDHGFSVIEKRGSGYLDIRKHNQRMLAPFAPVHIVSVQQFIDKPKHTHGYVMDAKGKVYDPDDETRTVVPCYEVRPVMGFFKD